MTRQSQKNEEIHFARKAAELLDEAWQIESGLNEESWPDLIVSNGGEKFGLEVRSIFKDEKDSGSYLREIESIRNSRLRELADSYYSKSNIPVSVKVRGDLQRSEINEAVEFIESQVESIAEWEQLAVEHDGLGIKFYITRLPADAGSYRRWQNVSDYVGWVSKLSHEVIESAILAKETKLEKYRKNINDVRLLLVMDRIKNSGRAEVAEEILIIESKFSQVYLMLYPEIIYRTKAPN